MPTHQSVYACTIPTGRIFTKFDIGDFYDNRSREAKLFTVREEYRELYTRTLVRFIVAG